MKKNNTHSILSVTSIEEYCSTIHIPPSRYGFYDIRKFEENMKTVNAFQPPFRHEFYAIALRKTGSNNSSGLASR